MTNLTKAFQDEKVDNRPKNKRKVVGRIKHSNNKKMEGKYDNDKYYEEDYTGEEYDNKEENINNNEFFGGNYEIENNDYDDKRDSESDSTVTSKENSDSESDGDGDGDGDDDGDNNVKNMYGGNIDTNYGNEKFVQNIEKYNIEVIKIDN